MPLIVFDRGILGLEQSEKDMLGADKGVPHLLRAFKREIERDVGLFAESFEMIHNNPPFFLNIVF